MSGPEFFGREWGFFEVTMPELVDALAQISPSLRAIAAALQASNAQPAVSDAAPPLPDTQAQPVPSEALQGHTDVMATLAQIARQHLGIVSLEVRKRDRLDFHEVSVLSVADALRAAYDAGLAYALSASTHRPRRLRARDGDHVPFAARRRATVARS